VYSSAFTRLTLTFFSRFPPPTDSTKTPSLSVKVAAPQPGREAAFPAGVVDAGGQFGDIIGGGIGFEAGNFAEIVDCMGGIARAEEKEAVFFSRISIRMSMARSIAAWSSREAMVLSYLTKIPDHKSLSQKYQ
jgi:hypothetical protein